MECKCLEVEEIGVATESLQPGRPEQRHIDYSVDRCTDEQKQQLHFLRDK